MRLSPEAHGNRPWRIHEITGDFRLEDVWALPTPGGPDDFPSLVELIAGTEPKGPLWTIRWKLGELLGWDDEDAGLRKRVPSLRDRLPEDLRDGPTGPTPDKVPFEPLYLLDDEFAAEVANGTVHGVLHLAWVEDDDTGAYRGQMAVLVKPNGRLGEAYLAAIKPFRYLLVYPAMLRTLERAWLSRPRAGAAAAPRRAATAPRPRPPRRRPRAARR